MKKTDVDAVISECLKTGALNTRDAPCGFFFDFTELEMQFKSLIDAFPDSTLHGFAIKSNPLASILRKALKAGMGAECASLGEVILAQKIGFSPESIVYDSPCKTIKDLEYSLKLGVLLNCDNLQEVERVAHIRETLGEEYCLGKVGLRVNPQVGAGTIAITSTASLISKFGIPLTEVRKDIIETYEKYDWMSGIHVHVGSQGCPPELLIQGARAALDLCIEINNNRPGQIKYLDIGGGLSVDYGFDGENEISFQEYVSLLKENLPELFDNSENSFQIVTEFGRRLSAHTGVFISHVEYTKVCGGRPIAICFAGADNFLRAMYRPDKWRHQISVHKPDGRNRSNSNDNDNDNNVIQDLAGPLCFSGDVFSEKLLPLIHQGDWICIHDSGGYTIAMHSRYTSQCMPAVYSYETKNSNNNNNMNQIINMKLLRKRESSEDVANFWMKEEEEEEEEEP